MSWSTIQTTGRVSFRYLLTAAAALAIVGAAGAGPPRMAPDARGYQTTVLLQQAVATRPSVSLPTFAAPHPPPHARRASVSVTVLAPVGVAPAVVARAPRVVPGPYTVAIRGPDGEVRRYPVEGRPAAVVVRQYTVQPGQTVTVYVPARGPRR